MGDMIEMHSDFEDPEERVVHKAFGPRTMASMLGFTGFEVTDVSMDGVSGDYSVSMVGRPELLDPSARVLTIAEALFEYDWLGTVPGMSTKAASWVMNRSAYIKRAQAVEAALWP